MLDPSHRRSLDAAVFSETLWLKNPDVIFPGWRRQFFVLHLKHEDVGAWDRPGSSPLSTFLLRVSEKVEMSQRENNSSLLIVRSLPLFRSKVRQDRVDGLPRHVQLLGNVSDGRTADPGAVASIPLA